MPMPPRATSRTIRYSPSRTGASPVRSAGASSGRRQDEPRRSTTSSAANRSWISPARSGWRWTYSVTDGASPRRWRWRNSSASALRSSSREVDSLTSDLQAAGHPREDVAQPLQGADVAFGDRGRADPQDLAGLVGGQLLVMAQGEDLAVDGVHPVQG